MKRKNKGPMGEKSYGRGGKILASGFWLALPLIFLGASSCLIKRTLKVPVSPKILQAKTATLSELLSSLSSCSEKIVGLSSSSLKVSFTSGKVESGKLQAYRSAPGYILLRRPDEIRLNIQNPVTKTSLIELLSVGNDFSIWYPRENKFFTGKNSTKELDLEGHPGFTARPIHIIEAILPQKMEPVEIDTFLSMEQDRDAATKYYVLSLFKSVGGSILRPIRKLWVDRSVLAVARQQTYDDHGDVVSLIYYSRFTPIDGLLLPLSVRIERPLDGYSLDLELKNWRVNPDLPETAFVLPAPANAERVLLKEKGRSEKP